MKKLIDIAFDLGRWDQVLENNIVYFDKNLIEYHDDVSYIMARMIFLWEELEKEKKKYMRKPKPIGFLRNHPRKTARVLRKDWDFNTDKLIRDLRG